MRDKIITESMVKQWLGGDIDDADTVINMLWAVIVGRWTIEQIKRQILDSSDEGEV